MIQDPMQHLAVFRERLKAHPNPLCPDDKPIHWLVGKHPEGFIIRDSAGYFSGIQFNVTGATEIPAENLPEVMNVLFDWMGKMVPEGKDWSFEVRDALPLKTFEVVND